MTQYTKSHCLLLIRNAEKRLIRYYFLAAFRSSLILKMARSRPIRNLLTALATPSGAEGRSIDPNLDCELSLARKEGSNPVITRAVVFVCRTFRSTY